MILERREFLRMLGITAGAVGAGGCQLWSVPDELIELAARGPGRETWSQSVCGLCESGCGLSVRLVDGLPVGLKGNPNHPLNRGGLCPVGHAGLDVLYAPDRLTAPMRRSPEGELLETTWDEALAELAARLSELASSDQGRRVALLSGESGTLFHGLARQVMASLGSPNVARPDDGQRLAFELTQGLSEAPGYDLAQSDLVLSFGLDLFEDGPVPVHAISALIGARATEHRAETIHIGTRLSPSATKAVQHVAITPDTYAAFALGVAHVLVRENSYDSDFVEEHTHGFREWRDENNRSHRGFRRMLMEDYYPDRAGLLCGCDPAEIIRTARLFAGASAPVAIAGGDAVRGSNGTWAAMAVHSLNALVGAFDRPGGVMMAPPIPFNPLPRVNGELGRSLFTVPTRTDLLNADPMEAIAAAVLDRGESIDVMLLVGANPVFESAARERVRETLARIPLVVAMTPFLDESSGMAHMVLPTHTFLESWQGTTTPETVSFSLLGVAAPTIAPLHDTRHPADILLDLGRRASSQAASALPWERWEDYIQDRVNGVIVSGQGAIVTGSFEESWVHFLEERGWRFQQQRTERDYWNDLVRQAGWWNPVITPGDWQRMFPTPTGRFEFYSSSLEARYRALGAEILGMAPSTNRALRTGIEALGIEADETLACLPHFETPRSAGEGEITLVPFRPLTARGRIGTQSRMLMEMFGYPLLSGWETWAAMTSEMAHELDLGDGDLVAIESNVGSVEAVIRVHPGSSPRTVHVPVGLGHDASGPAAGIGANPLSILAEVHDPISGARSETGTRVHLRLLQRRALGGPAPMEGGSAA